MGDIKVVSPEEFTNKITAGLTKLIHVSLGPVIAIAMIALIIGVILMMVGNIIKSKEAKSQGLLVIKDVCLGVLLYFLIPLIIGVLKFIGQSFNN